MQHFGGFRTGDPCLKNVRNQTCLQITGVQKLGFRTVSYFTFDWRVFEFYFFRKHATFLKDHERSTVNHHVFFGFFGCWLLVVGSPKVVRILGGDPVKVKEELAPRYRAGRKKKSSSSLTCGFFK